MLFSLFEYDFVPLPRRPKFMWPGDAPLAVTVTVGVEMWDLESAGLYAGGPPIIPMSLPPGTPDMPNWSWREYGQRVGIWRILDVLDRYGVRASAVVNTKLLEVRPEIFKAMQTSSWELVAHGYLQGTSLNEFAGNHQAQRQYLEKALDAYERVVGRRSEGWVSPALVSLPDTPEILADLGVRWFGDFLNDDQPFLLRAGGHELIAVPYSAELNDYSLAARGLQPSEHFVNTMIEQFEVLYEEAERSHSGRIMSIGLHPHVTGQAFRIRGLAKVLEHISGRQGVWHATRGEVAAHYRKAVLGR